MSTIAYVVMHVHTIMWGHKNRLTPKIAITFGDLNIFMAWVLAR